MSLCTCIDDECPCGYCLLRARAERAEAALADVARRQREACAGSVWRTGTQDGEAQVSLQEIDSLVRATPLVTDEEEPK